MPCFFLFFFQQGEGRGNWQHRNTNRERKTTEERMNWDKEVSSNATFTTSQCKQVHQLLAALRQWSSWGGAGCVPFQYRWSCDNQTAKRSHDADWFTVATAKCLLDSLCLFEGKQVICHIKWQYIYLFCSKEVFPTINSFNERQSHTQTYI